MPTSPDRRTVRESLSEPDYAALLADVVVVIEDRRADAIRRTNALAVDLYAAVGRCILRRQQDQRYGSTVVDRLAADLSARFGGSGWSPRNLWYMRSFALAWPEDEILQARLQNLSWTHHQILLDKVKEVSVRRWYVDQALANRWSSRVLALHIAGGLHERIGRAPTNFAATLPPDVAGDLLAELATDPRRLDFLALHPAAAERDVEAALVARITDFLTHLGRGFAYVGRQFRLSVGDTDFFLDLLFFNTELNCYVVFELKVRSFTPGDAGQLAFYVTAIERQLRRAHLGPTIGVLLVPGKRDVVVEYALASLATPMAVADYTAQQLPAAVRQVLPDPAELATAIGDLPLADP